MSSTIAITTSHTHQRQAAKSLSEQLVELGCNHAYIGGFAWALLGSSRPTEDIDILIQLGEGQDMMVIRRHLEEANAHFATAGFKLFFVQSPDPRFRNAELVRRNRDNVLIETLKAGTLGLPKVAGPVYEVSEEGIRILHPTILILTKFNRWYHTHQSTRPKTRSKVRTDTRDITFMLDYLADKSWKIEFEKYTGNPKEKLLRMVAIFHGKLVEDEEDEVVQTLQEVMYPGDWEAMRALPSVMEAESTMPPADDDDNHHHHHQQEERGIVELLAPLDLGQRTGDGGLDQTRSSHVTDVQGQTSGFTQHDGLRQAAGLNSNGGLGQNSGLSQDNQAVSLGIPDQSGAVPLDTSNESEDTPLDTRNQSTVVPFDTSNQSGAVPHDTPATISPLVVGGGITMYSEDSIQQQQRSIEEGLLDQSLDTPNQSEIVNGPLDTPATIPSLRVDGEDIGNSEDDVQQQQSLTRTEEEERDSSFPSDTHSETVGDRSDEEIQGWIVLS